MDGGARLASFSSFPSATSSPALLSKRPLSSFCRYFKSSSGTPLCFVFLCPVGAAVSSSNQLLGVYWTSEYVTSGCNTSFLADSFLECGGAFEDMILL